MDCFFLKHTLMSNFVLFCRMDIGIQAEAVWKIEMQKEAGGKLVPVKRSAQRLMPSLNR